MRKKFDIIIEKLKIHFFHLANAVVEFYKFIVIKVELSHIVKWKEIQFRNIGNIIMTTVKNFQTDQSSNLHIPIHKSKKLMNQDSIKWKRMKNEILIIIKKN